MSARPTRPLAIIRGLGGNGSTYLSRAIAAARPCLILNECNPRSAHLFSFHLNPLHQLAQTEPKLAAALDRFDMAELGSPRRFGRLVDRLLALLGPDRPLVLRDYNFADFVASPLAWNMVPESSLDAALGDRRKAQVLLVRDPVDQYLSLARHRALRRTLDFRAFLRGALAMLDAFDAVPQVRYEDLFDTFDVELPRVLALLALPDGAVPTDPLAPLAIAAGNPRGRTSRDAERPARDETAYAALAGRGRDAALLAEVRRRTGYPV